MKKRPFLLAVLIIATLFTLAACSTDVVFADPYVTHIAVDNFSAKNYFSGDALNLDGARLKVTYSDATVKTVDLTLDMLSGYDMSVPEENKVVTVSYGGVTATFTVNVYDLNLIGVDLTSLPVKTVYIEGENIDPNGATITLRYEGGMSVDREVTADMLATYDRQRVGKQTIHIPVYGFDLEFEVEFLAKTVTEINVLREPYQNSVFKDYGDLLSIDGMRLRLVYDNGVAPEFGASEISDSLKVYLDDSEAGTTVARVAYLPEGYPDEFVYEYSGNAMVSVGDFVTPGTEIAGNQLLGNITSKSYGVVKSIAFGRMTISSVVDYSVTETAVKAGDVILFEEVIGRYGSNNVRAAAGGGLVLSVEDGKITVQTAPVGSFNINVKDRSYQSMEIVDRPITEKYGNSIDAITQGDSLDLSTGRVRVTFDNGEVEYFPMDSALIRVVNSDDDMLRNEIKGLHFSSVDDVRNLPVGRYELRYDVTHGYDADKISTVVTVIDERGKNMFVQDNRFVSLEAETNYTVSITVTLTDAGQTFVSECVYYLATDGAGIRHNKLDISAAGRHNLLVIFGGVKANAVNMTVTVIQRYPVKITLVDGTDNISGRTFYKGDTIPLTTLEYYITYNNGDVSEPTGITLDMLAEDCSLYCDRITDAKTIYFVIPDTEVISATLTCSVAPAPIGSVSFVSEPVDTFLDAPAESGAKDVSLVGGVLRVYYANGRVVRVGDGNVTLQELLSRSAGERLELSYNAGDDRNLTAVDIYENGAFYTATLTYYDEDGASASCALKYYVIDPSSAVSSIKVTTRQEYFKSVYIQCEDWDLSGIEVIVTYAATGTTERIPAKNYMIYGSTTDEVGTNISVKFRYFGKTDDNSIKITVEPRTETAIEVTQTGKDLFYTTDREPDLSQYRFSIKYNEGAPGEVIGVSVFDGAYDRAGWYYEVYDLDGNLTQFRRAGIKTLRLYHVTVVDSMEGRRVYNRIFVDFTIEVRERETDIDYISYDDISLGTHEDLPILAETAKGWELFLNEYDRGSGNITPKFITVHYSDGALGYVDITREMTDYSASDRTLGFRIVTISYKGKTVRVKVRVLDARLASIRVEQPPKLNFIVGSELTLDGGILGCVFEVTESDGKISNMYKYLYMNSDGITTSGYNGNIPENEDRQEQSITVSYRGLTTTYNVFVYNKQALTFQYQNTIFFYGNTKAATATPLQLIPEFDIPASRDIKMWYACDRDFIKESDFAQYLIDHNDVTEGDFMKIRMADGSYCFVKRSDIREKYYIEPAPAGYDYYIIMEVDGNEYYREENYCYQKFTIISKVIEVNAIDATENAFVKYYSCSEDAPAAIMYLYLNLDNLIGGHVNGVISSVEMLSPSARGFEIAVFVNSSFDSDNSEHLANVNAVFNLIESTLTRTESFRISVGRMRQGVNIGEYNGLLPEFISYRVAAGETLTQNNVLELLEGTLALDENYDYGAGTYRITVGTLGHRNYNIDFKTADFVVRPREISGYYFRGGSWNETDKLLAIEPDSDVTLVLSHTDGTTREIALTAENTEVRYYSSSDYSESSRLTSRPNVSGTTCYAIVGKNDSFSGGGLKFTLTVN